jgi:hypothetical protein
MYRAGPLRSASCQGCEISRGFWDERSSFPKERASRPWRAGAFETVRRPVVSQNTPSRRSSADAGTVSLRLTESPRALTGSHPHGPGTSPSSRPCIRDLPPAVPSHTGSRCTATFRFGKYREKDYSLRTRESRSCTAVPESRMSRPYWVRSRDSRRPGRFRNSKYWWMAPAHCRKSRSRHRSSRRRPLGSRSIRAAAE